MEDQKRKYVCLECPYRTDRKKDLIAHQRKHTGEKPYACSICGKSFAFRGNWSRHELTHSKEKRHECEVCAAKFSEKCSLKKHMRLHTRENLSICSTCGATFISKSKHDNHVRLHTGEKPFKCSVCEKSFSRKDSLKKHLKCHDRWTCNVCNVSFTSYPDFDRHRHAHADYTPRFDCSICGKLLVSESSLSMHMRIHTREKCYCCTYCDRKFVTEYEMQKHSQIHKGKDLPFELSSPSGSNSEQLTPNKDGYCSCSQCGDIMEDQKSLKNCFIVQTDKPKQCVDCKIIFFSAKCFQSHRQRHIGKRKRYACPLCVRRYCDKRGMIKHVKGMHSQEAASNVPFSDGAAEDCSFCEKRFPSDSSLAYHEVCDHRYVRPHEDDGEVRSGERYIFNEENSVDNSAVDEDDLEQEELNEVKSGSFSDSESNCRGYEIFVKEESSVDDSEMDEDGMEKEEDPFSDASEEYDINPKEILETYIKEEICDSDSAEDKSNTEIITEFRGCERVEDTISGSNTRPENPFHIKQENFVCIVKKEQDDES